MLDLSIIVPVYNTPNSALERCFDSILKLRDIAFEVLLIDDGSREETAKFCREYAENHPEFIYFRKENGGVSSARNEGISRARGIYMTFMDSDDCLLSEAFTPAQFQSGADMIIYNIDVEQQKHRSTWKGLDLPTGPVEWEEVLRKYINSYSLNGPCAKLFKTEQIQRMSLCFDKNFVTAEDWMFGCCFALQAEKIFYVDAASYLYYRDGGTSLSRLNRFPDKMLENLIAMYYKRLQILEDVFHDAPDAAQLRGAAAAAVIENMFNCAADLYLLKKLTPARKERILEITRQAKEFINLSDWKKAYWKAQIITGFWAGIYPAAHLRAFYLKHKK